MLHLFKYMWYRNYRFSLKSWKEEGPAAVQGVSAVTMLLMLNAFTVILWLKKFAGLDFVDYVVRRSKLEIALLALSFPIAVLLYWVPGGRYKKVIEEFDRFDKEAKPRQKVFLTALSWLYQLVTFVLFGFGIYFLRP